LQDDVVVDILRNAGWLEFLQKFEGFQEDIVDDFLRNLRDNQTVVRGVQVNLSATTINHIYGLPEQGERFYHLKTLYADLIRNFSVEGELAI